MRLYLMINMKSESFKKLSLPFALVLVGFAVLFAFPAEADKSQVEFEASLTVPAGTYQYKSTSIYVPAEPESVSYVASFNVPSGEIVKFQVLDIARFELWQEGIFEPNWVMGNEGSYGIGISSQFSNIETLYLIVLNNASSSSQEVKVWLSRTWHESNKLGWLSGSAMVSLGIGVTPLLMFGKSRRQAVYSATIFAMAYILVLTLSWAPYSIYPPYPSHILWALTEAVPGLLFLETFPLIVLLYQVEKNNGFTYFKNWNAGKQLWISGVLLMFGYIVPIIFMLFRMVTIFWRWPIDPDYLTVFSVAAGCLLMLGGLMIFVGLAATHQRRRAFEAIPNISTKRDRL